MLAAPRSVTAQDFDDGLRHLRGEAGTAPTAGDTTVLAATPANGPEPATGPSSRTADPVQFLQQVMNDAAAPLALRLEAAKALLQASPARSPRWPGYFTAGTRDGAPAVLREAAGRPQFGRQRPAPCGPSSS